MRDRQQEEQSQSQLRFKRGDAVRIVQGVDTGRTGEIVFVYPKHARPYMVKMGEGWFVHFSEDRLTPSR